MRRPSLRSQLNQIRLWVRQGRTDAWIAHKLDISVTQLEQFKRNHELTGDSSGPDAPLPVTAEPFDREDDEEEEEAFEPEAAEAESEAEAFEFAGGGVEDEDRGIGPSAPEVETAALEPEPGEPEAGGPSRGRRRGRRGGRRRGAKRPQYEATFEHGEDGYGLWLDPSVADDPVYAAHWAGHRSVAVSLEQDAITIRRAGPEEEED
jgi:hypothetical protein